MLPNYSVLLSLYDKERPEYLKQSLESIVTQSLKPYEVIIVLDGPINDSLLQVIGKYQNKYDNIILVKLLKNKGLGLALNSGLNYCTTEYVFRMDTDDICIENRFEKQLKYFIDNKLDLLGSNIKEFDDNPQILRLKKNMPITHTDILSYSKKRNPFNHPTVLFKKSIIEKVGGYHDVPLFEDYDLWIRVIQAGAKCGNIDDVLVLMRGNQNMYKRRGGITYIKKIYKFRKKIYMNGYINLVEFIYSLSIQSLISIIPNRLRIYIYKQYLRN